MSIILVPIKSASATAPRFGIDRFPAEARRVQIKSTPQCRQLICNAIMRLRYEDRKGDMTDNCRL
jgi:hypothetical protein